VQVFPEQFFVFLANVLIFPKEQSKGGVRHRRFVSKIIVSQVHTKQLQLVLQQWVLFYSVYQRSIF
jgi:hypothetical protein